MNTWHTSIRIALLLLVAVACQRQEGTYIYEAVNADGWHYDSAAVITIDTLYTTTTYTADLHVRLTQHYPYDELLLAVEQTWQLPTDTIATTPLHTDRRTLRRDTLHLHVAKASNELSGAGMSRRHFQVALPPIYLHAGQSGTLRITPAMHVHRLRGISDVGIRLQPIEQHPK